MTASMREDGERKKKKAKDRLMACRLPNEDKEALETIAVKRIVLSSQFYESDQEFRCFLSFKAGVQRMKYSCKHCRGTKYVLDYWLEKFLEKENIHMTDIPEDVFKLIPIECLKFCHCNPRLVLSKRNPPFDRCHQCDECDGTTWRFTEEGQQFGYQWRKVVTISIDETRNLPCEYFERCPCGDDDKTTKKTQKKAVLKDLSALLKIRLPQFGFGGAFS